MNRKAKGVHACSNSRHYWRAKRVVRQLKNRLQVIGSREADDDDDDMEFYYCQHCLRKRMASGGSWQKPTIPQQICECLRSLCQRLRLHKEPVPNNKPTIRKTENVSSVQHVQSLTSAETNTSQSMSPTTTTANSGQTSSLNELSKFSVVLQDS